MKHLLSYLETEARVCQKCYDVLVQQNNNGEVTSTTSAAANSNQPKPNNPMDYCSVVPPHQQVTSTSANPPTVMVPVGVLKRKGLLFRLRLSKGLKRRLMHRTFSGMFVCTCVTDND